MYIAVVCKGVNKNGTPIASLRSNSSWCSFIESTRGAAVRKALEANDRWGGDYTVLVGELKHVARPKRDYTLQRLGQETF
jgi:hypothetical protein